MHILLIYLSKKCKKNYIKFCSLKNNNYIRDTKNKQLNKIIMDTVQSFLNSSGSDMYITLARVTFNDCFRHGLSIDEITGDIVDLIVHFIPNMGQIMCDYVRRHLLDYSYSNQDIANYFGIEYSLEDLDPKHCERDFSYLVLCFKVKEFLNDLFSKQYEIEAPDTLGAVAGVAVSLYLSDYFVFYN